MILEHVRVLVYVRRQNRSFSRLAFSPFSPRPLAVFISKMASRALFQTFSRARCYNPLTARVSSTRVVSGLTYRSATTAANAQPSAPPPEAENTEKVQNGTSSELTSGFPNQSYTPDDTNKMDWSRSYFGLSSEPFSKEISTILQAPVESADVEITPGDSLSLINLTASNIHNNA